MQTGGQLQLTDAEQKLDAVLFKMKQRESQAGAFPPAVHFFKARELIRASPIFSLLQRMPKGMSTISIQCVFLISIHTFCA